MKITHFTCFCKLEDFLQFIRVSMACRFSDCFEVKLCDKTRIEADNFTKLQVKDCARLFKGQCNFEKFLQVSIFPDRAFTYSLETRSLSSKVYVH